MNTLGVLDSGLGGLTIWQAITDRMPNIKTAYFADSLYAPYGNKTEKQIFNRTKKIVSFLTQYGCKTIVLACNTITVTCIDKLRSLYPTITFIGTVPAIKTAVNISKTKKIGILSTIRTTKSIYQHELINSFAYDCEIVAVGTNDLVPFIEQGKLYSADILSVLKTVLTPFIEKRIDVLVLGCTHYSFLMKEIEEILKPIILVDSREGVAKQVEKVHLQQEKSSSLLKVHHDFFTTGEKDIFLTFVEKLSLRPGSFSVRKVNTIRSEF